ncbi:hypothetical protein SERLADRAFT_433568 [Serpula lacrymans var. lacrymans S7.9]|uniref:Uncharacterized protein n=1 Tax=Serpula lacrymans var. lacrymans (strain S7.9) TaxID=578457 RepID=F8NGV6_SERL9|nr:uncharacterized protein SERLADRAFT_433568 [Serpula lacrymans var. lacrymans S7.9]EGO29598.1 hypothetical protein SERLADRAFT_433568 [Serpula lacrymans var. lacrymans S7.9]
MLSQTIDICSRVCGDSRDSVNHISGRSALLIYSGPKVFLFMGAAHRIRLGKLPHYRLFHPYPVTSLFILGWSFDPAGKCLVTPSFTFQRTHKFPFLDVATKIRSRETVSDEHHGRFQSTLTVIFARMELTDTTDSVPLTWRFWRACIIANVQTECHSHTITDDSIVGLTWALAQTAFSAVFTDRA